MTNDVSQQGAKAHGDVVGHDKIETHFHPPAAKQGIVEQLLEKLQVEVQRNEEVRHTIEALAHFQCRRSRDGVDGLEAKLKAGQRADEYLSAIEKKELFVKLLEKWSLYASAQEIFAYLLARVEYEFNFFIHPQIAKLDRLAINQLA